VPAERVEIGGEVPRFIEPLLTDLGPPLGIKHLAVEFDFPQDFQRLPLGVIINAREPNP